MDKPPDAAAPGRERRRRLRAVFAADAANFGGLVSVDETKTLDSLWTTRRIATQELGKHGGWLFGMPGDGIFALFESAVDAVRCALDIQSRLAEQPAASILNLRVGIHLGEVLFQDELPFGEALVIAARLESLAEPGGILVSQSVMEAVASRIQATFADQGVRSLKHSPRQIKTYIVSPKAPPQQPSSVPSPEPLDLTLVPGIPATTPSETGTMRGPLRPANSRPGGTPVVESRPLPPPLPVGLENPIGARPDKPAVSPTEEPPFPERTVFRPGRQIAPVTDAAGLPESAPSNGDQSATDDMDGTATVQRPERQQAPLVTGGSAASAEGDCAGAVASGAAQPEDGATLSGNKEQGEIRLSPGSRSETDFDPDRTVVLPHRRVDSSSRVKQLPKASPFEIPAPPAQAPPAPEVPVAPASRALVQAAIPDIAQALTSYLGPIARVLVKRNAETCSSPQALIESVATEIPAEAERQAFRERAGALVSRLK